MPLGSCERFTTVRTRVNASTLIDTDIRRLHLPSMTHRLEFVETIHDRAAVRKLLFDYYTDILPRFEALGGPELDAGDMADDTLNDPGTLLPPHHRFLLAYDVSNTLLGCGSLKRIRDDAAEMKRMFVRDAARGTGLGRTLFEDRIAEARRMGLKWLYADTIKGNRAMLAIYEKHGFDYIDRYPENTNPEEFAPYLVFLRLKL
jgi:GNAT superfamily N-acetyltransferase